MVDIMGRDIEKSPQESVCGDTSHRAHTETLINPCYSSEHWFGIFRVRTLKYK